MTTLDTNQYSHLLPDELRQQAPRSLPRWARSVRWAVLLIAASATLVLAAVMTFTGGGVLALIPVAMAVLMGAGATLTLRKRRLLSFGTPTVGRIVRVEGAKGITGIKWSYETSQGTFTGSAGFDSMRFRRDFGVDPKVGGLVYVVFDPKAPGRSAIWGFART